MSCVPPFVLTVGLRLETRKERIIFLKVPQSKFWCPVCAPAAEKFWRRHLHAAAGYNTPHAMQCKCHYLSV